MVIKVDSATIQRLPAIRDANLALISAFESHSAFPSQANKKAGKVYFMWDFAKRTNAMFESILDDQPAPDTPATRSSVPTTRPSTMTEAQKQELIGDAVGRCFMLHSMITDTTGMSGMMFGEMPGQGVELGDAVKNASAHVDAVSSGKA